jgi:hypothetical protein
MTRTFLCFPIYSKTYEPYSQEKGKCCKAHTAEEKVVFGFVKFMEYEFETSAATSG